MWEMFLMLWLLMAAAPEQHRRGSAATLRSLQAFTGATRLVFFRAAFPILGKGSTDGEMTDGR
ncbi:MAG: hypothetical protein EOS23_30360 [Mesorhizobium sp.]|nr:MAG: hypothetical protein EOS23_30360 [Mesorhizobium sp.]